MLTIKPLAIALWLSKDFKGIHRDGLELKVSLYADDLLLYVSDLASSLPCILDILIQLGKILCYQLNLEKSKLFPLNSKADALHSALFPFERVQNGFKYLGIEITHSFPTTFMKNFVALLNKCKQDLSRWASLPLSLAGRVDLIKMIVLPTFLYLFQNVTLKHLIKLLLLSYGGTSPVVLVRLFSKDQRP